VGHCSAHRLNTQVRTTAALSSTSHSTLPFTARIKCIQFDGLPSNVACVILLLFFSLGERERWLARLKMDVEIWVSTFFRFLFDVLVASCYLSSRQSR
jgi:hypothetical protein